MNENFRILIDNINWIPWVFLMLVIFIAYPLITTALLYPSTIFTRLLKGKKNTSPLVGGLITLSVTLFNFILIGLFYGMFLVLPWNEAYQRGSMTMMFLILATPGLIARMIGNLREYNLEQ